MMGALFFGIKGVIVLLHERMKRNPELLLEINITQKMDSPIAYMMIVAKRNAGTVGSSGTTRFYMVCMDWPRSSAS
jgi:hypothetical protein